MSSNQQWNYSYHLPSFWKHNVNTWFQLAEETFRWGNVQDSQHRYESLLEALHLERKSMQIYFGATQFFDYPDPYTSAKNFIVRCLAWWEEPYNSNEDLRNMWWEEFYNSNGLLKMPVGNKLPKMTVVAQLPQVPAVPQPYQVGGVLRLQRGPPEHVVGGVLQLQ